MTARLQGVGNKAAVGVCAGRRSRKVQQKYQQDRDFASGALGLAKAQKDVDFLWLEELCHRSYSRVIFAGDSASLVALSTPQARSR